MIKITPYGSAQEIGKSCLLIEDKDTKVILDCGLKIRPDKPTIGPTGINKYAKDLQGIIISHAHFDHSGYIPRMIREGYEGDVHMTHPTKDIIAVLWRDHLKIEGPRHWNEEDMYEAFYQTSCHYYEREFKIADGVTAKFYDAGHILGSASILLDWKGQLIFYTGDINTFETPYHDTNKYPTLEDISLIISESTNGLRDLPNREEPNKALINAIYETRNRGGVTMIPTFALGRSQELEAILAKEFINTNYRIFVDGMILKMNRIYRSYFHEYWVSKKILEWCKDLRLEVPFDLKNFIPMNRSVADDINAYRKMIVNEDRPNIILSTSGMLDGGPIHIYLQHGAENPRNLLALSGYQVKETTGRKILEGERRITLFPWSKNNGYEIDINAEVKQFRFSGHAQRNELIKMLRAINGKKIMFVHGELDSAKSLKEDLTPQKKIIIPENEKTFTHQK